MSEAQADIPHRAPSAATGGSGVLPELAPQVADVHFHDAFVGISDGGISLIKVSPNSGTR